MINLRPLITPNQIIDSKVAKIILVCQLTLFIVIWTFSPFVFLPNPSEVIHSLSQLWGQGIFSDIMTSFYLNVEAIILSIFVSLGIAYLSTIPIFENVGKLIGKLRFSSLVGLTFFFTVMTTSGHQLKLSLLIFSISVFFVTSLMDVISSITKVQFDLAKVLQMGDWRILWEVVILGQIDKVFDALRQNAAIGWMMLTMVEGMSRTEGGIGAVLLNQTKYFHLADILAIQIIIIALGIGQDYFIGIMKNICCPYAALATKGNR